MNTYNNFLQQLQQYSDQLVNAFTLGQLSAAKQMYLHWLSGATTTSPDILSQFLAGLFVALKFCLPLVFVGVILSKLTKNLYVFIGGIALTAILYSYLYFNPYTTFIGLSQGIQNFREFLHVLPSIKTEPFLFTFLTSGAVVFALHVLVGFLGTWSFFMVVLGLTSLILWIILGGKNPWSITDKNFKAVTLQLTIAFLIFWAVFGSFKAFLMTIALLVGTFSIASGLRTIMGYQKYCYTDSSGHVKCKWVK